MTKNSSAKLLCSLLGCAVFFFCVGHPHAAAAPSPTPNGTSPMSPAEVQSAKERYERQKLGFFVHYVPGLTVDSNGAKPSIDELATTLDARQFAQDMADFGVEYVIFTVMHLKARTLYPSEVNKRWRDDKRQDKKEGKTYSDADVIDRVAAELSKKNIDLHLYVHPVDGHDFSKQDQNLTGWNDCSNDHKVWNDYQNELFGELCARYGRRIAGLWYDGKFAHTKKEPKHECIQQERLRKTVLAHNPALALVANVSLVRTSNPFPDWKAADYRAWEISHPSKGVLSFSAAATGIRDQDSTTWPATKEQVAMITGRNWWAVDKKENARYTPETLFRYLVLQASASRSGGLAISAGCFPGTAAENSNGNIWEGNFRDTMLALRKLVDPLAESIKNTNAGKAYPTSDHETLEKKEWGVSTESPDGKFVFLHIVKPPATKTLPIGPTADGSTLGGSAIHLNSGKPVSFKKTPAGYEISLPEGTAWDALDTVIKVQRL